MSVRYILDEIMETVSECDKFYVLHIQREILGIRNIYLSVFHGINIQLNVKG
jgi:hypothetical protein